MEDEFEMKEYTIKRNELMKQIEEKQRLMELIRNPNVKNPTRPFVLMKRNEAIRKIQAFWKKRRLLKAKIQEKEANKLCVKYIGRGKCSCPFDFVMILKKIQKAIRRFLLYKSREAQKLIYMERSHKKLFEPIRFDRVNAIRSSILSNIKQRPVLTKDLNFQNVLNEYYDKYRAFNFEFPDHVQLRDDNFCYFQQCKEMLDYLHTNNDAMNKFEKFKLNKNKEPEIRIKVNKIIESIEHKSSWYTMANFDEFEEMNILNEVDSHFKFERRSDLLNKK